MNKLLNLRNVYKKKECKHILHLGENDLRLGWLNYTWYKMFS
jgi:hypothetical protein